MSPKEFRTDKESAEALFNRYRNTMKALAISFMGNIHDAEDVVQLSMIKIMRNINKIDDIDSLRCKHFIMVITKNTALSEIRKNKNKKTVTKEPSEMVNMLESYVDSYRFENVYDFRLYGRTQRNGQRYPVFEIWR